jgi:hypothetical protein
MLSLLLPLLLLQSHYPQLMPDVRIRVVELMDHVLSAFDWQIGEFTAQQFKRSGLQQTCLQLCLSAAVSRYFGVRALQVCCLAASSCSVAASASAHYCVAGNSMAGWLCPTSRLIACCFCHMLSAC